jgi:uncharacterized protein YjbJ (UPF0337 family)
MNKDQIKGSAKDIAGKAQRKMGEVTGNEEQEAEGLARQGEGKVQKGVGNVKDAADSARDKLRDDDRH